MFSLNHEKILVISKSILIISICYSLFGLTPNNFGDPNDYINLAKNNLISNTLLRSFGYPLFIKITSLNINYLYITIIFQIIIFYFAILKLEKSLSKYSKFSFLIILLLSFPKFSYSQTLLFPDGLILSLFIFLLVNIIEKNYKFTFIISVLLTLIKLFFCFLILISIFLFLFRNNKKNRHIYLYFIFIPFLVFFYFFQPDYLVQFMYGKNKDFNFKINKITSCGIAFQDNDLRIKAQHGFYFPIYKIENINLSEIKNCDEKKLNKDLSQAIIKKMLREKPFELVLGYSVAFTRSLVGLSTQNFDHLTSMIKNHAENYEKFLINLKSLDLKNIQLKSKNTLNDKINKLQTNYENRLIEWILGIIFLMNCYYFFQKRKDFYNNELVIILLNSSIFLTLFSSLIADRYIMYHVAINLSIFLIFSGKLNSK